MKLIWRFHDWYDKQQEPLRFGLFLLIASPIIMTSVWVDTLAKALVLVVYIGLVLGPRMFRYHTRPRRRVRTDLPRQPERTQ